MKTNFNPNRNRPSTQLPAAAPAGQPAAKAAAPALGAEVVSDLKAIASGEASAMDLEGLLEHLKELLGSSVPVASEFTTGSESSASPLTSSDDSPLLDEPPVSSDEPFPDAPQSGEVTILGNLKVPRTLKSYFEVMERRGIQVPVDWRNMSANELNRKVPKGHSVILSADGKVLGMKNTKAIKADKDLGVGTHGDNFGNKKMNKIQRVETTNTGGDVEINGKTYKVARTFLKSPVMLDLNGDGALSTTGVSTAKDRIDNQVGKTVMFDVDGDGVKDQTEWMAGTGDGMLVDDHDGGVTAAMKGNGEIDGTRLYGDQGGQYANGYDKMAKHDADGDGKLTGAELEGLKTWIDDGDAKVEAGELKSLDELGVSELSVEMQLEKNARGEDLMRSTFVQNGQTKATEDVWFASQA